MADPGAPQRPRTDHDQDERHPGGWRVNPSPDGRGSHAAPPVGRSLLRVVASYLAFMALLAGWVLLLSRSETTKPVAAVPYSVFLKEVSAGNVVSISAKGTAVHGKLRRAIRFPPGDKSAHPAGSFKTEVPEFADPAALSRLLTAKNVEVTAQSTRRSLVETLLSGLLPVLLFAAVAIFLFRRLGSRMGAMTAFGRSSARRVEPSAQRVSFSDVAGIDEAKAELAEIADFLRDPAKYRRLGGRIPRGVLLTGPPGTGKTLLARALAGEAGVPFFSISASEFVEMFVGVGASRVRDLFARAKEAAPAIVFIDELDAIGRSRGPAGGLSGGGHDEREQTLNQILTEMDGFDPSLGVIVISATNRPEIIDRALTRPGRFDRRIAIQPPDTNGRRKILDVHTRSVPLGPDADLDRLAAATPGMVGADLANIVNEAALLAARRGHDAVSGKDIDDALEKLVLGTERRILLSPEERRRTACHEAGHALVGMLTPGADPVRKVSIIPRGQALGITLSAPEADRFSYDEEYLEGKLNVLLGSRAAERLMFGTVTTGAENDLRQATELARHMVAAWGMSEAVGPVVAYPDPEQGVVSWDAQAAPETRRLVDLEVRRIVEEARDRAGGILEKDRWRLERLIEALLAEETLDEAAAYAAAGLEPPRGRSAPVPVPAALTSGA